MKVEIDDSGNSNFSDDLMAEAQGEKMIPMVVILVGPPGSGHILQRCHTLLTPSMGSNFPGLYSRSTLMVLRKRYPGVDITNFFNFGLNEESWKDYCKQCGGRILSCCNRAQK